MPAHAWTTDLNLAMHRDSWADMPQIAGSNPEMLDQFGLDELPKATLTTQIQRRLAPKALKFRADVEVHCFGEDGVEAVKAGLRKGKEVGEEGCEVKIELLASPIYVLRTSSLDKNKGIVVLNKSIELIKEEMAKYDRGEAKVKDGGEPRCVTNYDDVEQLVAGADNDDEEESDDEFEEGISDRGIAGLS